MGDDGVEPGLKKKEKKEKKKKQTLMPVLFG